MHSHPRITTVWKAHVQRHVRGNVRTAGEAIEGKDAASPLPWQTHSPLDSEHLMLVGCSLGAFS